AAGLGRFQRRGGVRRRLDFEAGALEVSLHRRREGGIIINDHHARHGSAPCATACKWSVRPWRGPWWRVPKPRSTRRPRVEWSARLLRSASGVPRSKWAFRSKAARDALDKITRVAGRSEE